MPTTNEREERFAAAERLLEQYFELRAATSDALSFEAFVRDQAELSAELLELYSACGEVGDGLARGQEAFAAQQAEIQRMLSGLRSAEFDQRYAVEGEVGKGGMGAVYRVIDRKLDRPLAMKVILGQAEALKTGKTPPLAAIQLARFLNEARITGQLDHPGIVPVHEVGVDHEGRAYFTMKLVKGRTLGDVFQACAERDPQWSAARVLGVIQRACEAVGFAHNRGVIHRDLKPANVMVGDFGEVYVMDWGLARRLAEKEETAQAETAAEEELSAQLTLTQEGQLIGTPAYMSPEQASAQFARMGPPSDVYAIGAMLYQLIAGHPPYIKAGERPLAWEIIARIAAGPPQPLAAPETAPELIAICEKAMARSPQERYANTSAVAADLSAYLEGKVVGAYETGAWAEAKKWMQRNKALSASLAAAVVLLVLGLTASLVFKARADERAEDLLVANTTIQQRLYVAAVTGAQTAHRFNEPASVRRLLDSAPEELRNWEWHYLNATADTSLLTLQGGSWAIFSPDGKRIVTGSEDKTARVWDAISGKEITRFEAQVAFGLGGASASFSPDGSRVVASVGGTARVWDAVSGKVIIRRDEGVTASFSPDGLRIVSTLADTSVRVWDAMSGKELAYLDGSLFISNNQMGFPPLLPASFSPDGSRVLTVSGNTASVWDAINGRKLTRFEGHTHSVSSASFSPDGLQVVTSDGKTSRVWEARSGTEITRFEGHLMAGTTASFSPDGSRIVTALDDKTACVWDAGNGRELARIKGHTDSVHSASFSPDGSRVVTASSDKTARVWDAFSGSELARLEGHTGWVHFASFSPDGSRIVTASGDGTTRVWDGIVEKLSQFEGSSEIKYGTEYVTELREASFSPDGSRIVTTRHDNAAHVWDATGCKELVRLGRHTERVSFACFSPDGSRIFTASADGTARLWDAVSGKELAGLIGDMGSVRWASFSPDGTRVVTTAVNWSNMATVWDVASGTELTRLEGRFVTSNKTRSGSPVPLSGLTSASFSPDGTRIVTAQWPVRVWDAVSGRELAWFEGHGDVKSASFSPDGSRIVTSDDKTARVWDVVSGRELARFEGHASTVWSASFSPDGSRVVTASSDKTARVWDAFSGSELARLEGHTDAVTSASFSPDGSCVLTASSDNTVRVWDGVPYRVRYAQLEAVNCARSAGERAADELLGNAGSFVEAGSRLWRDDSLHPLVRRVALNVVSERATSARKGARELLIKQSECAWLTHLLGIEPWADELRVEAALSAEAGLPTGAHDLNDIAQALVDPDTAPSGEEMRALLIARRALEAASLSQIAWCRMTLARALYRLGRFDQALEEQREALVEAPAFSRQEFEDYLRRLEADIATWRDDNGELRRAEIGERIQALEREIAALERDPDVRRWVDEE